MTIKERSLLEKPVLFVQEGENMWPYQRRYTDSGLPYYSPPVEKNNSEETKILEVLFIPISNEDFDNDKENYFFGYMYLFFHEAHSTMTFTQDQLTDVASLKIQ